MPGGRPEKSKEWLSPEGLALIEGWARDGMIEDDIAKKMGIVRSTLFAWKNKYPEITNALKAGKEVVDRRVESALLKRALGYEYEEVRQISTKKPNGTKEIRVEKVNKVVPPDTTAQIFWLKNRRPDIWRNNPIEERAANGVLEELIKGLKDPEE